MKKRGQFYLIAAIIIVMVIIGLSSITNYITTKKKPGKFYDLGGELNEESSRVIDYGIYNEVDVPLIIENFTGEYLIEKRYIEEKEKETELFFIYGDKENATGVSYTSQKIGIIAINYGTTPFELSGTDKYVANRTSLETIGGEEIKVKILNVTYTFNLQEGENFLFVIAKKTDDETYIIRS